MGVEVAVERLTRSFGRQVLFQDGALFGSMNLYDNNINVARTVPDNLGMLYRRKLVQRLVGVVR